MLKYFLTLCLTLFMLEGTLFAKTIDVDTLTQSAYKEKKIPLVYLHRIGCSYCNSMEEFTLDDENVIDYIQNNFVLININVSLDDLVKYDGKVMSAKAFASEIGYAFYPASLFLSKDAEVLYAAMGYKDEDEFMVILRYIKEGHFKQMGLESYKAKVGFSKDKKNQITDKREDAR